MPLHGKIVVVMRSGVDGTEFPLTSSCLFGRKQDCDIRIQLPQVSKEHCRIDLNENKEVILTNLSSVNPTRVNGEALQQSERLKHGDVITIIDRSFRFEYPPAPTPKKRSSIGGKAETLKVLHDQQVGDTVVIGTGEKRISGVSIDPHLKDGTNHDNIQRAMAKTVEVESKEDDSLLQTKTTSPFNDLYQMIKKSLDVKTPRKSSSSKFQTPASKICTPKRGAVGENGEKLAISTEDTPKKNEAKVSLGADGEAQSITNGTPKSVKKQRRSSQVLSEMARPVVEEAEHAKSEAITPQKRRSATPQRSTISEVIEQISAQTPKSPMRRRSKEATPAKEQAKPEKVEEPSKKRKSGELATDLPKPQMKKKRVSFGGYLAPELFDKKLPPDSPLRKGATPRRSLSLPKPKQSLLRRASVIGLLKEFDQEYPDSPANMTPSPKKKKKNASPKTPTPGKKSPKSNASSPKAQSPGKKSPKSSASSPKAQSPGKKSPKSNASSPKAQSPGKKSPKSNASSPKAQSPGKKSPKPRTPSPKAPTPGKNTPKSKTSSPKAQSPGKKSPNSKSASPARGKSPSKTKSETPTAKEQPKTPCRSSTPGQMTPAKTPLNSQVNTPTMQGRFSVSRINTPSPVTEDAVNDQVPSATLTPKIPLRRKSMKSTSRKTPSLAKSAVKVMHRRSGISRASMKALNSWADIVKFGQTKVQAAAPAKQMVNKKTKKKTASKPQTPARKLISHVSTGHADSPVTILVGRAHKQRVVQPTGNAPRVVTNTALFKRNMKMDEDLTGVSEMFKTPANERKRRSLINENSATKTPVCGLSTSVVEPSVLNTPEELGEMMVSPLSVASPVRGRRYNSEAVQRLLNGDEDSSFVNDNSALETHTDDQQCADMKTTSVATPKQKPELPESLTGVKRIMKTPRQKAEPVEDIRGKLLKTPKQKPEQQECFTGVKRIMKTPRQKAEPVEDIRGKLLKTPKQKPEQQECLTGVKRIMKTPRQKAEPVEDIRGNLLKTPKQKPELQECLTGVKRIMKTPEQEAEPLEDLQGELLKTPTAAEVADVTFDDDKELETAAHTEESQNNSEIADMKTPTLKTFPLVCLSDVKRMTKTPREKSAPVEDMIGVKRLMKTPKEKAEPVEKNFGIKRLMKSPRPKGNAPVEDFEGLQELMEEPLTTLTEPMETTEVDRQSDVILDVPQVDVIKGDVNEVVCEAISLAAVEKLPEEQLKAETATSEVVEIDTSPSDPDDQKKPTRGRRATTVESKAAEDKQEVAEHSEDPVVLAPARGRRGKKTEANAPPAVRQTARNRNAKSTESKDAQPTQEESASLPSKVALKLKRGRNAKKASDDQAEMVQEVATETEMVPEPESEQSPPVDVNHTADDSEAPLEKAVLKPKRGRKTKQESEQAQSVPEQQDVPSTHSEDVLQADMPKEVEAKEVSSDQLEVVAIESNEVDMATCTVTETVQKKPVRGRRAKLVESKAVEDSQEAAVHCEDAVESAPVRGRRGKKTAAAAPPAARKTTRGRNAKSQEGTTDDQPEMVPEEAVETKPVTEVSSEATPDHMATNASQEENEPAPPEKEAVSKPSRGRRTKQTPVEPPQSEPEKSETVCDQPEQPATVGKQRRGRKRNTDTVEQNEVVEDTVVTVETKQPSQPPVRAKRGRNAKHEEEKVEDDDKTTSVESQDLVKKSRRTRKAEQEHEEVQTVETLVPEEAEAPTSVAAKPGRGGRKAKQVTESITPVESTETQEVPVVSTTDKPKRGRRVKQVAEEVNITAEVPEEKPDHELETEENQQSVESSTAVVKTSRARGAKTSVKNETQAIPAKRARRGTAPPEETKTEESAPISVEPAKRGRRAAAKPTADDATVSSDQANLTEDSSNAVVEDTKTSKKSVKWQGDLEVYDITPLKAVRGRKSKLGGQDDAESNKVSQNADKTEEDLSDKVAESQPAKRARRGAKVADVTTESTSKVKPKKAETMQAAEAETQPKTRRGRSAKK